MEDVATQNLTKIIQDSLKESFSVDEYLTLLRTSAEDGRTTGPTQSENLINYTKLNAQRTKRVLKTTDLSEGLIKKLNQLENKQTWLLITESWCGDAASSVPVIARLAEMIENIDLRIVLRDENLDLMDEFLTNGGRSIPKLIALNESGEVQFTWGPRPKEAQILYDNWKNQENPPPYSAFQIDMQKWYNQNKGVALQEELLTLLNR